MQDLEVVVGDTKGVRRIERGWGTRDILTSEQSLGKIMIMADNLEGLPTVSTVIEMVIIKLPAQTHLSATIVGKMGTKLWLALQKKGFNLRLCGFGLQGQEFYYIQIPEEEGEPQLKTFPGILSMREGRASETIIDNELKHLFRGGSGWTIQQLGENEFIVHFPNDELRYELTKFMCFGFATTYVQVSVQATNLEKEAMSVLETTWVKASGFPTKA
jgi:hypothetical protein